MSGRPYPKVWVALCMLLIVALACNTVPPRPTATLGSATAVPTLAIPGTQAATPVINRTPLPPIAPRVIDHTPVLGDELSPNGSITVYFDGPMDQHSVEASFSVQPGVQGSFKWLDPSTVQFVPGTALKRAAQYTVTIQSAAKNAAGLALPDPVSFKADTVGFLEVTQVLPAPDAVDAEARSAITLMFNRPVVPLTALQDQSALPNPLTLDPPASGKGQWLNTSIYIFRPDKPLAGGQTYTGKVAAGLQDTTGGLLASDFTWHFAVQPPAVVSSVPAFNATNFVLTDPISMTFNQPMDHASVAAAFHLQTSDSTPIAGQIKWSADDLSMSFFPAHILPLGAKLTATLDASAKTAGGASLGSPYTVAFSTVPPPAILSTNPADGDQSADSHGGFRISFSAPMDVNTLEPNIDILPKPTQVYTSWSESDSSFFLGWDLQPSTDYVVTLSPGMRDPYGNAIPQGKAVKFHTAALPPEVFFNARGPVGTYNAYSDTVLYLTSLNLSQVKLSLYKLSLDQFAALTGPKSFDANQKFAPAAADLVHGWIVNPQNALNQRILTRVPVANKGGPLPTGLYYLRLTAPGVKGAQTQLLVVSGVNVTLKLALKQALVWATDLNSGQPVPNLPLTLYDEKFQKLVDGQTDAQGLFQTNLPDRPDLWTQVYAVSQGGSGPTGFSVGLSDWSTGVDPWDFGLNGDYYPHNTRAYVYTDRPIYRPGQVVYFKGALRNEDDARFSLPSATPVNVSITNDQGQPVYSDTLTTGSFGTLAGHFQLAPQTGLGFYNLTLSHGDQQFGNVSFSVAQYVKPDFQVLVASPMSETVQGTTIPVTVDASFFFGGPVSNAKVHWSLLTADHVFPYTGPGYFDFYDFDWSANQAGPVYGTFGRLISEKDGQTDAQGHASLDIPADLSSAGLSQQVTIEAMVTDANGQQVSGRIQVIVHQGTFYIGVRPEQYVGQAGQPLNVNLLTVDWHSNPAPKQALHVVYNDHQWNCALEKNPDTGANAWTCHVKDTPIASQDVTTDDKGTATGTFTPPKGGTYQVKVTGTDAGGHTVTASTIVWVSSGDFVTWRQDNNDRLTLVADRKSYKPGDTAEILIPSPFQGPATALVTVERGRILTKEVLQLTSNSTIYKLPMTPLFAPDVFVSVVLVKGVDANNPAPAFKVGTVELKVSPEQQQIKVSLTPDKPKVGPRDTVTYQIMATDFAGKPVQAEFSVGVVDLAVLSLAPPNSSPILDAFYGEHGLSVRTSLGLTLGVDRLNVAADQAKGGGGGGGGQGGFDNVRTNFLDTAFWNASVVTDDKGQATVSVKLPDNLTTWRLDARGLTANDTLVGQGTVDIVATKDLLIQPTTPRFFVVGDQAQLGAEINNNTANDIQATVSLTGTGVSMQSPLSQVVTVKAHDRANVNWNVTALDAPAASLTFSVAGGGLQDASKPTVGTPPDQLLPIYKYSAPSTSSTAGQLEAAGTRLESISLPRRFDASQGSLDLQLDPSLAASLTGALNDLKTNPNDDGEAIVSSFLPNVLTFQALKKLGQTSPDLESSLTSQVNTALQRLYTLQHVDGGWGWWSTDQSDPFVTAYTLFGLVKAQQSGFAVSAGVISNAVSYLQGQSVQPGSVSTAENWKLNRQAFILYTLAEAGQGNTSATVQLFDARERLDTYARAYLALALNLLNPGDTTRAKTILSDINNAAIVSATGAHWEESQRDWWDMNTDTRSTAIVLEALVKLDPGNSQIPNVVRWLMLARKASAWETTQETAWALIGLTDWMVASGELKGQYDYSVDLNGTSLAAGSVKADNLRNPVLLHVAVSDLFKDQANRLTIGRGAGDGRLYYTAHLNVYEPVGQIHAINSGISVSRQYRLKTNDCGGQDQPDCKLITEATAGQDIQVRVSLIAPNDLHYVTLEDPLPAGAEAVNTNLLTTSVVGQPPQLNATDPVYYGWGWWWFSNTELRDQKVVLFASFLPKGNYEYTYIMHASLPGTYQVIPTQARETYFPEVQGTGDGVVFKINP